MIIDRLTQNGVMEPSLMYEPPFTGVHHEGLDGAFRDADSEAIIAIVQRINAAAA